MSATVIDGQAVAAAVRAEVKAEVKEWVSGGGRRPGLATILVGDDAASAIYVAGKQRASEEVGIEGFSFEPSGDSTQAEVEALLRELNEDPRVSGILLQLPTPEHIDGSFSDHADRSAQGRRRVDPDFRGPPGQGTSGPAALHPGGGDGTAPPPRRRTRGR